LKQDDLNTALELKPFAILSNDYESLQAALLDGKPVSPASPFGCSVGALARQLRGAAPRGDLSKKDVAARKNAAPWLRFLRTKSKSKSRLRKYSDE
jgi:hypothetical protein